MKSVNLKRKGALCSAVRVGVAVAISLFMGNAIRVLADEAADAGPDTATPTITVNKAVVNDSTTPDLNKDPTKVIQAEGELNDVDSSNVQPASFTSVHAHSVAMTALHNQYRTQAGLSAQAVDPNLSSVAQRWADHMASVGSMYHGGGEQIIAYSGGDLSYDAGFRLWLNSSPHRAWLYSRGDRCGFGYSIGRNGCAYFAGAFGSSSSGEVASSSGGGNYQSVSSNSGRRLRLFRRRG
jgi:uncharacterized protein YkwD